MPRLFTLVVLLAAAPLWPRTDVVVFPLKNSWNDPLAAWGAFALPERFRHALSHVNSVHVWDPAFLFPVDSSGWTMESDSLLAVHRGRWQWNVAVGGSYTVAGDSVRLVVTMAFARDDKFEKKVLKIQAGSMAEAAVQAIDGFLAATGSAPGKDQAALVRKPPTRSAEAYRTFCAGFGYQMRSNPAAALSAYQQAVRLDNGLSVAWIRMGQLHAGNRDAVNARACFTQASAAAAREPAAAASMALFLVEFDLPAAAQQFVDQHRELLSQTSDGLAAIGRSYMASGQFQRAISSLTRAVALGSGNLEADLALGQAYLASGNFMMAGEIFNRLISQRPDHTRYHLHLGAAFRKAGRLMQSVRVLETAYRLDPENTQVLIGLAHSYFELRWYPRAEQLLLKARALESGRTEIDINLGVVYWHMGRTDEAREVLRAVTLSKRNMQASLNNSANMLFLSGDIGKALKAYRKADRSGAKNELVLLNLGFAYESAGRAKEALQCYEQVLMLSPERQDVLHKVAAVHLDRGNNVVAEQYYRKILELSPYDAAALSGLTRALEKQGRSGEAVEAYEAYLASFPNDREFRVQLAELSLRMKWYEVAIMKFEQLVQEQPKYFRAQIGLGRSMYGMIIDKNAKNYDKTVYVLKAAASLNPADPEAHYLAGMIYLDRLGYRELAVEQLNAALKNATDPVLAKQIRQALGRVQ